MTRVVTTGIALLLASCGGGGGGGGEPCAERPIVIVGPDPASALVSQGEAITFTARVQYEDGSPAEGYEVTWLATRGPAASERDVLEGATSPAPGVSTVTWTPRTPFLDHFVTFQVDYCDGRGGAATSWVQALASPATAVVCDHDRVDLALGEARPISGYAVGPGRNAVGANVLHRAGTPIAFRVLDEAVATVDEEGVVSAVAEGTTELELSADGASVRVPLTVGPGTLGPPAPGEHPLPLGLGTGGPDVDRRHGRLAVDDAGNPTMIVELPQAPDELFRRSVVATWTGSGFGSVEYGEGPGSVFGQVAIDERGRRYVLYDDEIVVTRDREPVLRVWDADASARRGGGTTRDLPVAPTRSPAFYTPPEISLRHLWPRPGGGAFVAWQMAGDHLDDGGRNVCRRVVRLASVTDAGVEVEDVEDEELCRDSASGALTRYAHFALLPVAEAPWPTLVAVEDGRAFRFDFEGGRWMKRAVGGSLGTVAGVEVVQGRHAEPTIVLDASEPGGIFASTLFLPDVAGVTSVAGLPRADSRDGRFFAGYVPGSLFAGYSPDALARVDDFGRGSIEGEATMARHWIGFAADRERLYSLRVQTARSAVLTVARPGRPLRDVADTAGQRLGDNPRTATPRRPVIMEDGTRVVATVWEYDESDPFPPADGLPDPVAFHAGVYRSDGPGSPLSLVHPIMCGDDACPTDLVRELVEEPVAAGTELYGMLHDGGVLELVHSSDRGRTWTQVASSSVVTTFEPADLAVLPTGEAFLVAVRPASPGDIDVLHTPALGTTPFASIEPDPAFRGVGIGTPGAELVVDGAEVLLFAGGGAPLLVRRYAADGTLLEANERTIEGPVQADTFVRLADGRFLGVGAVLGERGSVWTTVSDDLFATETRAVIHEGSTLGLRVGPAALADGRVVVPQPNVAAYRVSDDGVAWSDPIPFRPEGGASQVVVGLAAEPAGGFYAVLGDAVTHLPSDAYQYYGRRVVP